MSEFEHLNSSLSEFEQLLKKLSPAPADINEAELMFRVGRDTALNESRRRLRRWQFSTLTASVCALIAFGGYWFPSNPEFDPGRTIAVQPDSQQSEAVSINEKQPPQKIVAEKSEDAVAPETRVGIEADSSPNSTVFGRWWENLTTVSVSDQHSYLDLRNRVLEEGVEALPRISGGSSNERSEPFTSSPQRARELLDAEFPSQI